MSKKNTTPSLSFTLALVAGAVDREQSLAAAEAAIDAYLNDTSTQTETIAAAVNEVLDDHNGNFLTMPIIEGLALQKLNATPANYKAYGKLVLDYIRANEGTRESGKLFEKKKGVGGGVRRWSDAPPAETTAETVERPAK